MSAETEWSSAVEWLKTILTACSLAVLAWVSYWQRQSTLAKLRLDLYDRRFAIYSKTLTFFHALGEPDRYASDSFKATHREFIKAVKESKFLFDASSGIFERLDGMARKAFDMKAMRSLDAVPDATFPAQMIKSSLAAYEYFDESFPLLEKAMAPYLNFHQIMEGKKPRKATALPPPPAPDRGR